MINFNYQALDKHGKLVKGDVLADNQHKAQLQLKDKGLTIVSITQKTKADTSHRKFQFNSGKLSPKEILTFTRQLQSFCDAGIPLKQGLQAITQHSKSGKLSAFSDKVITHLNEGQNLARSLELSDSSFDELYVAQVRAGEKSGKLSTVLASLAQHLEEQQNQYHKIRMASLYPIILCSVALMVVGLLLSVVLPKLVNQLSSQDDFPLLTRVLMDLSHGLQAYGIYLLSAFIIALLIKKFLFPQAKWRYWLATHTPGLQQLLNLRDSSQYLATLGVLYNAGIPLAEAASSAADVIKNTLSRKTLARCAEQLSAGHRLAEILQTSELFGPNTLLLISNGEHSGRLGEMIDKSAKEEKNELNQRIELALALLEPILITVVGGIVFLIVLAILLPMMQINSLVS